MPYIYLSDATQGVHMRDNLESLWLLADKTAAEIGQISPEQYTK